METKKEEGYVIRQTKKILEFAVEAKKELAAIELQAQKIIDRDETTEWESGYNYGVLQMRMLALPSKYF